MIETESINLERVESRPAKQNTPGVRGGGHDVRNMWRLNF